MPAAFPAGGTAGASGGASAAFAIDRACLAKSASFTVTRTVAPQGGAPLSSTFHIVVSGNNARVDYDDPALGQVRYLANAKGAFLYIPGNNAATQYDIHGGIDAALHQAFQFVTSQEKDLKRVGSATVSGQPTAVYKNLRSGALVYVGTRPGFRLPVKGELKNEGGMQSFLVSAIELNISPAAALFALPAGTQIIRGDSGSGAGSAGLAGSGG
jgi:hypothetical protein